MRLLPETFFSALLLLPSVLLAGEVTPTTSPPAAAAPSTAPSSTESIAPQSRSLAQVFDLRSGAVRNVIRTVAATQSSSGLRVESPARHEPHLAATLKVEHPVPSPESLPRLPQPSSRCNGFWSCGLETLLGLHDHDFEEQQEYARQERNRLMNQGSFTDKSGCEACALPADPNRTLRDPDGKGAPIRP